MLDLRRLTVLREVALQGSLSAAAAKLMFSPSAVSQQIAQLERELGVTLVDRKSTGVELTPAGRLLVGHGNAILARAADAEEELRQLSDGGLGNLRVAAFSSAAATLMPQAIVAFRAAYPRVEIELAEQDRDASLDRIRSGELDLAIVVRSSESDNEVGVLVVHLLDDYVDVLLPSGHKLATADAVSLQELREEPWADGSGRLVHRHLQALGVEPKVVFRSAHHKVIEAIVAAGIAIAFVPRLAQPVTRDDVVVKPISPDPRKRLVGIAIRDGEPQPAAVKTMVEILHRIAAARVDAELAAAAHSNGRDGRSSKPALPLVANSDAAESSSGLEGTLNGLEGDRAAGPAARR